jgi:hypothetical protein
MIIPCVFGPLIPGSLEQRNFKTYASGCDFGNYFPDWSLSDNEPCFKKWICGTRATLIHELFHGGQKDRRRTLTRE